MATELQKNLAEEIVANARKPKNKRKNKKEMLVSAGYDETTALATPGRTLEQKGVKDALRKFGLTEELITTSLVEDIKAKPKQREKELKLGAEILGMTKTSEGDSNKTLVLIITGESAQRYGVKPNTIPENSST